MQLTIVRNANYQLSNCKYLSIVIEHFGAQIEDKLCHFRPLHGQLCRQPHQQEQRT